MGGFQSPAFALSRHGTWDEFGYELVEAEQPILFESCRSIIPKREQRTAKLLQSERERSTVLIRCFDFPRNWTHVRPNYSLVSSRRQSIRSQILVIPSLPRQLPPLPIDIKQSDRPNDISKYKSIARSRHALKHIAIIPFRHELNVQRVLSFFDLDELEYLDLKPTSS